MSTAKPSNPQAGALAPAVRVNALNGQNGPNLPLRVTLDPAAAEPTSDQALWVAIRNRTDAIGFDAYAAFLQRLLCERESVGNAVCGAPDADTSTGGATAEPGSFGSPSVDARLDELVARPSIYGGEAYAILKLATEAFLESEGGAAIVPPRAQPLPPDDAEMPGEAARLGQSVTWAQARNALEAYLGQQVGTVSGRGLPYLKRIVDALIPPGARTQGGPFCDGPLQRRLSCPDFIELIWCYWHERGYLVQTMNAIGLRFQNSRRGPQDPLANLALDPIRPLANLLWGFVQDRDRLSVARRALEYEYAYGLPLDGKAVAAVRPVERRARFLECFHQLLQCVAEFYVADSFTTVRADGFRMLQALKELHLEMAESANNQYAELKRAARVEMMAMQYMLARKEMREFLGARPGVPYREAWMPQVQTMKRLQRWPQTSITHFRDLADAGQKLLLSVRLGSWVDSNDQAQALNWARYWKQEVQAYLHAYRAVTGVEIAARRVEMQQALASNAAGLPAPDGDALFAAEAVEMAAVPRRELG